MFDQPFPPVVWYRGGKLILSKTATIEKHNFNIGFFDLDCGHVPFAIVVDIYEVTHHLAYPSRPHDSQHAIYVPQAQMLGRVGNFRNREKESVLVPILMKGASFRWTKLTQVLKWIGPQALSSNAEVE